MEHRRGQRPKLHEGELPIDSAIVESLIAEQFPALAGLPLRELHSTGTVNAIYRIGDRLCARLPRLEDWAADVVKECDWLPNLAPQLSLRVPKPFGRGAPAPAYPLPWAVYEWIDGSPYTDDRVGDERRAAADLARFVAELRAIDLPADAPRGGRRPLPELDAVTRAAIAAAEDLIDADAAAAAWQLALAAPLWDGTPAWIHGDLLRPNLLVLGGRLHAVIDFGGIGAGDPATDVIAAWSVFGRAGRATFRAVLDVDDGVWSRARGIALHQALLIIPYYRDTNPGFVALAERTVEEILADAPP